MVLICLEVGAVAVVGLAVVAAAEEAVEATVVAVAVVVVALAEEVVEQITEFLLAVRTVNGLKLLIKQRRSGFIFTGLPPTGSWQDLKDHMREAGDVCYADVFKDGTGVVEFLRYEDMKYALRKLDDSKFRSHEVKILFYYARKQRW